jgi:hypothetical protein
VLRHQILIAKLSVVVMAFVVQLVLLCVALGIGHTLTLQSSDCHVELNDSGARHARNAL